MRTPSENGQSRAEAECFNIIKDWVEKKVRRQLARA
jgi:hypothetical protein